MNTRYKTAVPLLVKLSKKVSSLSRNLPHPSESSNTTPPRLKPFHVTPLFLASPCNSNHLAHSINSLLNPFG